MSNGFKFHDGPSNLDGQQIYGILTGTQTASANPKTGDMHQAWFLLQEVKPRTAVDLGLDTATCGQCPLRGNVCYVNFDDIDDFLVVGVSQGLSAIPRRVLELV